MTTVPLPGHDRVTTDAAREIVQRPQFPDGKYKGPRGHVAVNGFDLERIEREAYENALADIQNANEAAAQANYGVAPSPDAPGLREAAQDFTERYDGYRDDCIKAGVWRESDEFVWTQLARLRAALASPPPPRIDPSKETPA